ncbi:MAG TPA: methylated-DNA--[protein]-cysteine S-methyltransferase, partial [Candidatus Dormibacteraeota bacterium]|nr:methylated-DNA--[protein]-cysteine S-methyltransferase [Candidatus Dormibacteraeota bacterium]
MTQILDIAELATERGLRSLRVPAPAGIAERALVQVGLADAFASMPGPIGPIVVAWNGRGVSMVDLAGDPQAFADRLRSSTGRPAYEGDAVPGGLRVRIERRLAGDRHTEVPLDWRGRGTFERAVWAKALEIPRGEVRPYGWIAAEIGSPRAVRAVGTALGHNPIPLVVPCHRVVRTDGTIGRYSLGGEENKRAILEAEGVDLGELQRLAGAGIRYIGSDTTGIYCLPTCRHARRVSDRHRVRFGSAHQAAEAGYRP